MMQYLRGVRYLSAFLLCGVLGSCVTGSQVDSEVPPTQGDPNTITIPDFTDEIFEQTVAFWSALVNIETDPYPAAGSITRVDGSVIGSGILISNRCVLTAAHVATASVDLFWEEYDGDVILVDYVEVYPLDNDSTINHDIAILHLTVDSNEIPHTNLFGDDVDDSVDSFEYLRIVGYSWGLRKLSDKGVFSYYGRLIKHPHVLLMMPVNASVWHGDSGGPVFDLDGDLIGIVTHFRMLTNGKILDNGCASIEYYQPWVRSIVPKS